MNSLISPEAEDQVARLQLALSSVACRKSSPHSIQPDPPTADDFFIGRLILGLLCRGWPTHSSPIVEDSLLAAIDPASGLKRVPEGDGATFSWNLHFELSDDVPTTSDDLILNALFKADQRLVTDESEIALLVDSKAELSFYKEQLVPLLGGAIGWLELQRPIDSMLSDDMPSSNQVGSGRVDFSLEIPGPHLPLRVVIELDGPHHYAGVQRKIDNYRDQLLAKNDWTTSRVLLDRWESGDSQHLPEKLKAIIEANKFPFSLINDNSEWLSSPRNREASRLLLTPHAIARVQFGLTQALMDGSLSLNAQNWVIAVTEREVPCAEIAFGDWLQALDHMCRLYQIPMRTERVQLLVAEDHLTYFEPPRWVAPHGNLPRINVSTLRPNTEVPEIDVAIDVSVGAHPTRRYPTDPLALPHLLIRSKLVMCTAQRQSGYRTAPWVEPRAIESPMQHLESLEYFLSYVFRKRKFRAGQPQILERVLRRQDVIGLLPTGAGKSITFQLPALLSPGLTLVIDPIKSLMQDQVENLSNAGIMDAIQINADTPTKDRARIERQFGAGEYRLVFISPERLQIQNFRDQLRATANQRPIAYFVVDEAHCVSEWGHDFRTAYLNLGRIAQEYCSRSGERPPTIALTGTASESVLRDLQRELGVEDDDAIIRPSEFNRKELKFEIVPVSKPAKLNHLLNLLEKEIPAKLNMTPDQLASGECGGLIFCPHINGELGVFAVANAISQRLPLFAPKDDQSSGESLVGFYSGEKPRKFEMANSLWSEHKGRLQRSFKKGRTPLLVATKAFGMGIDKPNIRYTVHFAMAQSIEAFAQEAGRAGRDSKDAICAVLFTDRLAPAEGIPAPLDCLEAGIPVEDANKRAAAALWASDDAELQMFLHARSYPGVARESAIVRNFYHTWIEPMYSPGGLSGARILEVSVSELQIKEQLNNHSTVHTSDSQDIENDSSPDIQRIIYRMSLVGLIQDYTVRYQPGNNIYTLSICPLAASEVQNNLLAYVKRYRTSERLRNVEQRLDASPLEGEICKSIDTLCWFIYEEIEQRRRYGIENMRQLLRESSDGADLSRRLNEFLSTTALTQTIFEVLAADDYRQWGSVANQISSSDSAERVYYQCRRALEDAPGHPGLILLQALALLGSDSTRQDEVVSGLAFGFSRTQQVFSPAEYSTIVEWIVTELSRTAPEAQSRVMNEVILVSLDPVLARAVLGLIESGVMSNDPILVRTASRCLLERIDSRLKLLINS